MPEQSELDRLLIANAAALALSLAGVRVEDAEVLLPHAAAQLTVDATGRVVVTDDDGCGRPGVPLRAVGEDLRTRWPHLFRQ